MKSTIFTVINPLALNEEAANALEAAYKSANSIVKLDSICKNGAFTIHEANLKLDSNVWYHKWSKNCCYNAIACNVQCPGFLIIKAPRPTDSVEERVKFARAFADEWTSYLESLVG